MHSILRLQVSANHKNVCPSVISPLKPDKVFIMLSGHVGLLRGSVSECYFMVLNVAMADALVSGTASVSKSCPSVILPP